MALQTTDIIAPVLSTSIIVVFFATCVASQAFVRYFLGRFLRKSDDFGLVSASLGVGFTRSVARFAALIDRGPFTGFCELDMRSSCITFELILVANLARVITDEVRRISLNCHGSYFLLLIGNS